MHQPPERVDGQRALAQQVDHSLVEDPAEHAPRWTRVVGVPVACIPATAEVVWPLGMLVAIHWPATESAPGNTRQHRRRLGRPGRAAPVGVVSSNPGLDPGTLFGIVVGFVGVLHDYLPTQPASSVGLALHEREVAGEGTEQPVPLVNGRQAGAGCEVQTGRGYPFVRRLVDRPVRVVSWLAVLPGAGLDSHRPVANRREPAA